MNEIDGKDWVTMYPLTVGEAAGLVRRSHATIRRWIKQGILPAEKPGVVDPGNRGGKWNIRRADLLRVAGNYGGASI